MEAALTRLSARREIRTTGPTSDVVRLSRISQSVSVPCQNSGVSGSHGFLLTSFCHHLNEVQRSKPVARSNHLSKVPLCRPLARLPSILPVSAASSN